MRKSMLRNRLVVLAVALCAVAAGCAALLGGGGTTAKAAAPTVYGMNGAEISIAASKVDPFVVEDFEGTLTKLNFSFGEDSAVFTTAWLYPETPERAGVTEYAFEWKSGAYRLKQRATGGPLYTRQRPCRKP